MCHLQDKERQRQRRVSSTSHRDSPAYRYSKPFDAANNVISRLATCTKHWNLRHGGAGHKIRLFCFGQSISLCLALVSSASSTIEAQFGVVIPLTMSGLVYFVLSFHLMGIIRVRRRLGEDDNSASGRVGANDASIQVEQDNQETTSDNASTSSTLLHVPWWNYCIIAFLDVQANFIFMQSFRYTSLTSAQLLSSLAVPSAMFFSWIILRRGFRTRQFVGAVTCILGGLVMVLSDLSRMQMQHIGGGVGHDDDDVDSGFSSRYNQLHSHSLLGDVFAVLGAVLYGLTDTIAEHFVKNVSRTEYLGMLGLFGALISLIQASALEWDELYALFTDASLTHLGEVFLVVSWYVVCLVYVYIGFSHFLAVADVTLLILSLQTSQLWASLFSIVVQQISPLPSFYIAVVLMFGGVFIYEYEFSALSTKPGAMQSHGESHPILTRQKSEYGSAEVEVVSESVM